MRDKDRIGITLEELRKLWEKYPDLRLGQFLLNVINNPALYYIEDDELINRLKEFYNSI